MSIATDFENFCKNLRMSENTVQAIQYRYRMITKRINIDFWNNDSEFNHSFYTGSYGRGTAIFTSDIDMVVVLPYEIYRKYNAYYSNGQSALLQAVRTSLKNTYSQSKVGGDGQVVVIEFTDGIKFEIVPAFINKDESYTYPDSNDGGHWRIMNPKAEIQAFNTMNYACNGNLKYLCRMARAWNKENNVWIPGILIDTAAYRFISDYSYKDKSYLYYDYMSRDFMAYLYDNADKDYWSVPGSGWHVSKIYSFKKEAKDGNLRCIEAIEDETKYPLTAHRLWREHYGNKFPTV